MLPINAGHRDLALAAIRTHDYDAAERIIAGVSEGDASRRAAGEAATLLAVLRAKQGKIGAAIEASDQALRKDPDCREAAINLVTLLCDIGHYAEAGDAYAKYIGEGGRQDRVKTGRTHIASQHLRLGHTYRSWGLGHDAITQYHRAVQIDPGCIEALITLGRAHLKGGEVAAAVECLANAVETSPDDIESRIWYGIALLRHGKKPEAKHHWQRALSIDPQNTLALAYARIAEGFHVGSGA